ncbi:elongin-C isoform X1 [Motacilla alba alba]|uniref:elongin-C isoform X1 n=1 Tax=Motacilla alba alba TaxID=1094192 RepID=UPI0018D52ED5|nr:elongin-C isoform X1 [Motacilla alba alba]
MFSCCRPTPPNSDMAGRQLPPGTTRPSGHRSARTACREQGRRTGWARGGRKRPVTRAEALGGSWADTAALRAGRRERRPRVRGGRGSETPPAPRGTPRGRGTPSGWERVAPTLLLQNLQLKRNKFF